MKLSGSEKREIKSTLKTRPVDIKLGKRGLTSTFLKEAEKIISKEKMIKILIPMDREKRNEQIKTISSTLGVELIATVGKTAAFILPMTHGQ